MDNLTHSLVGAVLGQAGLKRKTGLAMPALIIGANLPDVDAACFFWLEGTEHLGFRRGITHGPPALVLLPLILAGLLWGWDRWQTKRGTRPEARLPVRFGWLYAMAFIGCLSHPALDWLNVYGIRLLEPFSSQMVLRRYFVHHRCVAVGAVDRYRVVVMVAGEDRRGVDAACAGRSCSGAHLHQCQFLDHKVCRSRFEPSRLQRCNRCSSTA